MKRRISAIDICRICGDDRVDHDDKTKTCRGRLTRFRRYTTSDQILDVLRSHEGRVARKSTRDRLGLTVSQLASETGVASVYIYRRVMTLVEQEKMHVCCMTADERANVYRIGTEGVCDRATYHA